MIAQGAPSEKCVYTFSDGDRAQIDKFERTGHTGYTCINGKVAIPKTNGHPVRLLTLFDYAFFTHRTPNALKTNMKTIYMQFAEDLVKCAKFMGDGPWEMMGVQLMWGCMVRFGLSLLCLNKTKAMRMWWGVCL